tara:strand:+ start:420 stop:1205 length:786 start_codon:yes stop_codon:yes gene_type:complete
MLGIGNDLTSSGYNNYLYSLQMDGAGDVVGLGDLQTILRGSFTINYWVRLDDSTPSNATMNGFFNNSNNSMQLGVLDTGQFNFSMEGNGTTVVFSGAGDLDGSGTGLSGNSQSDWIMITLTATLDSSGSSATTFAFYTNANAISTDKTLAKAKHTAIATGTQIFTFGARNNAGTGDNNLDGNITQFAIWNTALDADAVTALYNGGSPLNALHDSGNYDNSSALVRYYDFSQGSGTNLTDQTGNANGSILGNPIYSIDYPGS